MLIHFNLNLCGVQKMNDNVTALKLTIEEAKIILLFVCFGPSIEPPFTFFPHQLVRYAQTKPKYLL